MSNDPYDCKRLAQEAVNAAENLESAMASDDFGPHDDWFDWFDQSALEAYANQKVYGNGTTIVGSVTVVLGTGGPHYQYTVNNNGNVTGEAWGWFGQDQAEAHGYAPMLADMLHELFQEVTSR